MNEPEDHEIDITIEAVTGTVYDLCVSPFETILGIKTKIQRLEGIPVYQQHLIYRDMELQDEYCLAEYNIQTGYQLKLVITLRGGPVHAHRIQLEDAAILELAEYLESHGSGSDEYMLMLLNNGNLELINADDDRSQIQSPIDISESRLSGYGSHTSLLTTAVPKVLTVAENMNTRDKMRDIQTKLKDMRLNRAEHKLPIEKKPSKYKKKCTTKLIILDKHTPTSTVGVSPATSDTPTTTTLCSRCRTCHCYSSRTKVMDANHQHKLPSITGQSLVKTSSLNSASTSNSYRTVKPFNVVPSAAVNTFNATVHPTTKEISQQKKTTHFPNEHFLPPIVNTQDTSTCTTASELFQKKPERSRCMKCGKRTKLATTFNCRCGGIYCGRHRYPESHSCSVNYKAEGKQTIARNNPLVIATKLPKI